MKLRIEKLKLPRSPGLPRYETWLPKYEIWAPEGFRFTDGTHSHLERTLEDAKREARVMEDALEECPADCCCTEEEDK